MHMLDFVNSKQIGSTEEKHKVGPGDEFWIQECEGPGKGEMRTFILLGRLLEIRKSNGTFQDLVTRYFRGVLGTECQ